MPMYSNVVDLKREDAAHTIGTDVSNAADARDALKLAGLTGWNVRLSQSSTTVLDNDGVSRIDIPGKYAIVGNVDGTGEKPMGSVVTKSYHPVQNEQLADWCAAITDQTGAKPSAAGHTAGGNRVFVMFDLPENMTIGGEDPVGRRLVAFNSFDKSSSLRLMFTHVRLFCTNQLRGLFANATDSYSIRHTASATKRIEEVRRALAVGWTYDSEFELAAQRMLEAPMTVDGFRASLKRIIPVVDKPGRGQTIQQMQHSVLQNLWDSNDSGAMSNIAGTRWAAYNAFTAYADHYATGTSRKMTAAEGRAQRVLTGGTDAWKTRAFAEFRVPVSV